jgi:hypothetical protein
VVTGTRTGSCSRTRNTNGKSCLFKGVSPGLCFGGICTSRTR